MTDDVASRSSPLPPSPKPSLPLDTTAPPASLKPRVDTTPVLFPARCPSWRLWLLWSLWSTSTQACFASNAKLTTQCRAATKCPHPRCVPPSPVDALATDHGLAWQGRHQGRLEGSECRRGAESEDWRRVGIRHNTRSAASADRRIGLDNVDCRMDVDTACSTLLSASLSSSRHLV